MPTIQTTRTIPHRMPADLKASLGRSAKASAAWENITPLAQNEYFCWVLSAKKPETRQRRIRRTLEQLLAGQRRPCCWAGCIHRIK